MLLDMFTPPVPVFISYSRDSAEHANRVAQLASLLRADGVDVEVDLWVESPPEGWPQWMERQIRRAQFVLIICTEAYSRRAEGVDLAQRGRGACWESLLAYQHIYEANSTNQRFIPVVFSVEDEQHIPVPLRSFTCYNLSSVDGYQKLYRRLTSQPLRMKPRLGRIKELAAAPTEGEDASFTMAAHASLAVAVAGYTLPSIREFIAKVLVNDADLETFCMDFFPHIKDMFGGKMSRITKLNLLLQHEDATHILAALKECNQTRFERFHEVLRHSIS